jgi:hypothetical protein
MRQKDAKTAPGDTDAGGVELRVIRDQVEVRAVLGNSRMDDAQVEARNLFSNPSDVHVFLVFTDEGRGKIWLTDREAQNASDDDDEIQIFKQKLDKRYGVEVASAIWLAAKKLKGWTD